MVPSVSGMPITLIADPRVSRIPLAENGERLVPLGARFGPTGPGNQVRASVAARLFDAQCSLPSGLHFKVAEGFRTPDAQRAIVLSYAALVRTANPDLGHDDLHRLTSRYVAPLEVAPHVAGAALDLTILDDRGAELWMGTPLDATPEESEGACFFDAVVDREARANRVLLARVLRGVGLVNYPTEWWHWSFGDRYWAHLTGAAAALYGPVPVEAAA
ncbi:MAG: dipeptidase [Marmoricola sp.]|nr:dipeptidase [Marmoricola sp.]